MAIKQAKFDINSRPGKANSPNKVRPGSDVSDKADKRWRKLMNAGIDDTYPVDRDIEIAKSQREIDRASKQKAGRAKMEARKPTPRTDHPYLGGYRRKGA